MRLSLQRGQDGLETDGNKRSRQLQEIKNTADEAQAYKAEGRFLGVSTITTLHLHDVRTCVQVSDRITLTQQDTPMTTTDPPTSKATEIHHHHCVLTCTAYRVRVCVDVYCALTCTVC